MGESDIYHTLREIECLRCTYRPVQPLVSTDGGKTWGVTGPRLDSSDFEYFLDNGSELFIAGEDIAEGPAHNPFLLVYRATDNAWQQSEIYDQASELLGIAHEAKTGRFLAWVRHLDMKNDDWSGPIYLHQSQDRGKTWSVVRKVKTCSASGDRISFLRKKTSAKRYLADFSPRYLRRTPAR